MRRVDCDRPRTAIANLRTSPPLKNGKASCATAAGCPRPSVQTQPAKTQRTHRHRAASIHARSRQDMSGNDRRDTLTLGDLIRPNAFSWAVRDTFFNTPPSTSNTRRLGRSRSNRPSSDWECVIAPRFLLTMSARRLPVRRRGYILVEIAQDRHQTVAAVRGGGYDSFHN